MFRLFFIFFKPPPVYSTLGVGLGERVTKTAIAIYFHVHLLLRLFCMPDAAFRLFVLKRRRRNFYLLLFIFLAVGHYMVTLVYDEFSTRCATKLDKVPTFFLSFFPSEYSRLGSFTSGKLFQAKYFLGYLGGLVFGACTKNDPIINSVVVFVGKIFISSNYRCVTSNTSISSSSFTKMWLPLFCALYVPSKTICNISFPTNKTIRIMVLLGSIPSSCKEMASLFSNRTRASEICVIA